MRPVPDPGFVTRAAGLTVVVGLALAACTSGPSQTRSPRPPTVPAAARPLLTKLHQQPGPRFVKNRNGANPAAITVLTSSRNLHPGQHGVVLTVRGVGDLIGFCSPGRPAVKFRLTYRGQGPPAVTEVREPLARPIGLQLVLVSPYVPPSPVGGKQHFAFFQIFGGGESADFSLAVWATLTPVAGGCAFSANGVLRVRGSDFLQSLG